MTQNGIIALLLGYIIFRECFFLYSTHKFINKIMSTSFYEYRQASTLKPKSEDVKLKNFEDMPEDLGVLEGFIDQGIL